jgi:hypothetical protein
MKIKAIIRDDTQNIIESYVTFNTCKRILGALFVLATY